VDLRHDTIHLQNNKNRVKMENSSPWPSAFHLEVS